MKSLMGIIVKTIGWKRALSMVWDLADDGLKEYVKNSPEKWDDEAFKVIDLSIKALTSDKAA